MNHETPEPHTATLPQIIGPNEDRQHVRGLRLIGMSYGEIAVVTGVPKSTVRSWCGDITLTPLQEAAIQQRTGGPSRAGRRVDTQWRRRLQIESIRVAAKQYLVDNLEDPLFVAGVCLYWGEGSKTRNDLSITNADPRLLRLFIEFVREHLDDDASFALALHLHEGDDEPTAQDHWRTELDLAQARFTKTHVKKAGTGHRRKSLPFGICRVRVDRPSDHWHSVMQWIEEIGTILGR